jgi:multiple sugar transport system ATP-binding protein
MRPESLTVQPAGKGHVQGKVDLVESLGAETLVYVRTDNGTQLVARQNNRVAWHVGDQVGLEMDRAAAHLFDAQGRLTAAAT